MMRRFLISALVSTSLTALTSPIFAQTAVDAQRFRVFDSRGVPTSLAQLVERCQQSEVVFWGEEHNDATGHALQARFFQQLIAKGETSRQVALSLEMFERDTQIVLDEYLDDLITEKHFLSGSRPWENYSQDYKPLVLLAKEQHLPVIAANAPRRYVNLVSRRGRGALQELSGEAKKWLAPLPYSPASASYARKFGALMGDAGAANGNPNGAAAAHSKNLVDSQAVWDATMADSLAGFLKLKPRPLVLHLSGKFHSEQKLGTVEQLLHLRPQTKICVVTVVSDASFPLFETKTQSGLGDFVILTDPKVKRSF